jgi:hypothetical protein
MGAPPETPTELPRSSLSIIGLLMLAQRCVQIHRGMVLLQRSLGLVVALVLGFISLFNIPFETHLVLLPAQSQQEYEAQAASPGGMNFSEFRR